MGSETPLPFSGLLKEYRLAAGLTQEALAERAGVSARNIQNLERGENKPLKDTAHRLIAGLGLSERERALFVAAVLPVPRRRVVPSAGPAEAYAAHRAGLEAAGAEVVLATHAGPRRHNLPVALSEFVGREQIQAKVRDLLLASRLLTLTGTGGVGKTRLGLAVAESFLESCPAGVWLIELAPIADPAVVPDAVAQVLGVPEDRGRSRTETLIAHIGAREMLIVLDNCEHLLAACAALTARLLQACRGLRVLATSREALGVSGERWFRVPPLTVPGRVHLASAEQAGTYEAVRLFVARAQDRRDDFTLTEHNTRAIVEICARLDGMPLAIELAAARVSALPVEAIAARLDDRFRLLTGGARTALPRQQTLRALLDWSWHLLDVPEQRLLRRLAVFSGGWTLEAAESVCVEGGVEAWQVLDGHDSLVAKSLIQVDDQGSEARYSLLETVRQYCQDQQYVEVVEQVIHKHNQSPSSTKKVVHVGRTLLSAPACSVSSCWDDY